MLVALALVVPTLALALEPTTPSASAATRQSGSTTLLPQIVQPGSGVALSDTARLAGSVRFSPARKGRPVVIQRRIGSGAWQNVTTKRENGAGLVKFTAAAKKGTRWYTYRGVAKRWNSLAKVAARPQTASVWAKRFGDEFNGRTVLGPNWRDRASNAESRKCSTVGDPRASTVGNGALHLWVKLDPDKSGQTCTVDGGSYKYYLNGQVSTEHVPLAYTRGVFAARIKFQRNQGQHGSFWLQPLHRQYLEGNPKDSGAEIDIVEFFGAGRNDGGLASFLFNYGIDGGKTKIGGVSETATRMLPRGDAWWKNYHVFSLEWTRSAYSFRVDGREHFRTQRGVSGIDEYLILSLLSSDWELETAKRLGIQPGGTMHVDWAKVWRRR